MRPDGPHFLSTRPVFSDGTEEYNSCIVAQQLNSMSDNDTAENAHNGGESSGRYLPSVFLVAIGFILVLFGSSSKTGYSPWASDTVGIAHADAPIPEVPACGGGDCGGSCGGDGGGDCGGGDCGGGGDGGGDCP